MEPVFLSLVEVLEIHRDQIARYGGSEGVRDLGALQSALAMPAAGFGEDYFHSNLFEMAAAYLFHVSRNHPFVDGNKRTATVAALVFLSMNGVDVDAPEDDLVEMVESVARGETEKVDAAAFFRRHAKP